MKTLSISPNESLQEVKDNFSELFPNLKLEFFNHNHQSGEGNSASDLLDDLSISLQNSSNVDHEFTISVDGHKLVSTLESEFEKLGINIQLFRKSGNVWLQTTTTDHWSIAQQNKEAEKTLA